MAMIRASSAPSASRDPEGANPFWSEKAKRELAISTSRPSDLPPVPIDSDLEGSGDTANLDGEKGTGRLVSGERGQKRVGRQGDGEGTASEAMLGDCFRTPEALEGKKQKVDGSRGKGQGSQPQVPSDGEGLERALEEEMNDWFRQKEFEERALERQQQLELERRKAQNMQLLRDQNERLMQEIEKLRLERRVMEFQQQKQQSSVTSVSEWSAVSPPPPKMGSPSQERKSDKEELKYTPGGTRVPDGPPPDDQPGWMIPEFPAPGRDWQLNYEVMAEKFRTGRIGDREWRPRSPRSWNNDLRGGHQGGLRVCPSDRAWHGGVCREDRASIPELQEGGRAWHDGVCHDDRASIHGLQGSGRATVHGGDCHQEGGRGVHGQVQEDERVRKLEQEVSQLQEKLEKATAQVGGSWNPQYWAKPVTRENDGGEDRTEDSLRSFPITLPKLPEPTVANASLEAGDWLTQVRPLVADVSTKALSWWDNMVQATAERYHLWLSASPLERLRIAPPNHEKLSLGFQRLAQRVAVMLMQSVPEGIRQELVAMRAMDAASILFKVYRTYQPGGLAERKQMLQQLTTTSPARTATEAVSALRLWKRQAQRALELKAAMPDAVLQVRALSMIMEDLLEKDAQAAFRVNTHRMRSGIDVLPTEEAVGMYHELLLSEAEQMVTSTVVDKSSEVIEEEKKKGEGVAVKAMQATPTVQKQCHFWGSPDGCKLGRRCRYLHEWQPGQEKSGKCWLCSSSKHMKHDCPTRLDGNGPSQPSSSVGGSEDPQHGGKGKGKKGGKKGGKEAGKGKSQQQQGKGEQQQQPEVSKLESGGTGDENRNQQQSQQQSQQPENIENKPENKLMAEVTHLLKSLRVNGGGEPQIRVCQVRQLSAEETSSTLLDGGATHCLKRARSQVEWDNAKPVTVKLASGEAQLRQHVVTGTLLTQQSVQEIIPVSKMLEVGYQLQWTKEGGCKVEHPKHGKLPVTMVQGCPTLEPSWGTTMMEEIEELETKRAKIRAILTEGILAETDEEKQLAELRAMFPEVPLRILERVPGEKSWDVNQVPLNRRQRRKLQKASSIIINMFAGANIEKWRVLEKGSVAVLSIDVIHGINVMDPHVAGWLDSILETGKVVMWTSGPPCRSVSVLRRRAEQDQGPPVLRSRTGEGRFGLQGLTAGQQELADHDATLWLKNLWWMKKAKEKNPKVQLMAEQPQDPTEWMQGEVETMPSFLAWPETRSMIRWLGLEESRFDQGALHHVAVKPTTVIHNMKELQQIDGLKSEKKPYEEWPTDVKEGIQRSKKMAEWAPGLVEVLMRAANRVLKEEEEVKMRTLSAKERQEVAGWEAHFMANHVPYRRDCMICLESMGKDRQRRRIPHADGYTLAVDIAGPYQKGTDQESGTPRYLLVATVTIPIKDGEPLPHGLRQMGYKVKSKEEDDEMAIQEEVCGEDDEVEQWQEIQESEEIQALTPMELKEVELANEKWKEFLGEVKAHETQTLTWGVPLQSRASKEVVRGLSKIFTRFQMLQIPMYRLHSDRAKEFLSAEVKRWAMMHQLMQTYTAGDEPEGNARTEREIGVIKARTRLLLKTSKSPVTFWPLAARQALEERCRQQLWKLGVPSPQVLPFGATAVAKRKSWFNRSEPWKWPMEKVRVLDRQRI